MENCNYFHFVSSSNLYAEPIWLLSVDLNVHLIEWCSHWSKKPATGSTIIWAVGGKIFKLAFVLYFIWIKVRRLQRTGPSGKDVPGDSRALWRYWLDLRLSYWIHAGKVLLDFSSTTEFPSERHDRSGRRCGFIIASDDSSMVLASPSRKGTQGDCRFSGNSILENDFQRTKTSLTVACHGIRRSYYDDFYCGVKLSLLTISLFSREPERTEWIYWSLFIVARRAWWRWSETVSILGKERMSVFSAF